MGIRNGIFTISQHLKSRRTRDIKECIPLKVYAEQKHVHPKTVLYRIATRKLVAYKIKGRWYVDPRSTEIPIE